MATLSVFIENLLRDLLDSPEHNNLGPGKSERAWEDVVFGYSHGADELYSFWKQHIGEFHWTPLDAFSLGMTSEGLESGAAAQAIAGSARALSGDSTSTKPPRPQDLTVVAWVLSQTESTKTANRAQVEWPSEPWARARIFGQAGSRAIHRKLVAALAAEGHSAVAPGLLPQFGERRSEEWGKASNWSERHVAYTAGLGTFGLCGGLITPLGKAVRLGSIIVEADIPPTPRRYSGPSDYCLHFNGGACMACVDRCPVGSVSEEGRDKQACAHRLDVDTAGFVEREYGFKGYGCGLCQTRVPCESAIPVRSLR
jgi:ferredoxin